MSEIGSVLPDEPEERKIFIGQTACRILKAVYRLAILAGVVIAVNAIVPRRAPIRTLFETPRIYVTEVRYENDKGMVAPVYAIYYSINGVRCAEVFPTEERLLQYVAYLETVGVLVGPKDNGGWTASVWGEKNAAYSR